MMRTCTLIPILLLGVLMTAAGRPAISAPTAPPAPAPATADAPKGGLTVLVQSEKTTFNMGESIPIDVIIRNTGDTLASLGGSAFDLSCFRFVVTDPASKVASPTTYGKKMLAIPTHVKKNDPLKLKAGYQRLYVFELGKMYAFDKPGMYSITIKRVVVVNHSEKGSRRTSVAAVTLTSDPLAITITGTAPPPVVAIPPTDKIPAPPPAVKPDIRKAAAKWTIAFVRDSDIWLANGEGNEQRMIIQNGDSPAWSQDKSQIAFARNGNVWLADADGQNQHQLTQSNSLEAGVSPGFSPDGKWVAYRGFTTRGGIEIRVVSLDGKTEKQFLDDGEEPAW